MDVNDFMEERRYVEIINDMGGHVEVFNGGKDGIIVEGGHPLHGIEIDCKNMPDAIPALAVLNKSDLLADPEPLRREIEASLGIPTFAVSAAAAGRPRHVEHDQVH